MKIIIGIIIIAVAMITYGTFVYEMKKLPIDYETISEHEGQDRILKEIGGNLSEPFWIRETHIQKTIDVQGDILEIKSTVTGIDSATNSIIFDSEDSFFVDRVTRKHHETDDYFTFPPNVQKQNYEFFHPMIFTKTTFVFEKTRDVDGLKVYDFTCKYNRTDVSAAFPQFPSQTILSDGTCSVSVEPTTGMIVSFSKEWDDYFENDGIRGEQVEFGGKRTTEYSETILTDNAKSTKALYYLLDIAFPILILFIGISILIVTILFTKTVRQKEIIIKAQKELLKKERLSAIGEITAKLSHNLRNSLSSIIMSSEIMQMKLEKKEDPKIEKYLPRINEATSRIIHQMNQVLGFVKTMPLDMKLISLETLLTDAIRHTNIPQGITITTPKNDYSLMADKVQLSVAFGNILSNAVDAIGKKGEIIIRAKAENDSLIIEFENSGAEIPKEDMEQIFEPLFTTKPQGTGLGLSSVKDVIRAHGGKISVTSPPTIFKITLPLDTSHKE
ncbi:MAG: histidine kinase [Nitrosopumilales archaeon CG15_BIG_FIL_POST_REV_8_21_14_020_37_12]|nr:MAG: histidine kinase [Nitrosopumilales archaeon CG15_BIG_FIL_POST_REV_8_21_14_020_37_12]